MKQLKITVFSALLATTMMNVSYASNYGDVRTKDLIPVQRDLVELRPTRLQTALHKEKSLSVTAWVDRESATYRIGEKVKFFVKANRDAYIWMLNIGTSGNGATVIFPNEESDNNFVRAGDILQLPNADFDFQVSGPTGRDVTKVIATLENVNPIDSQLTSRSGNFKTVTTKDLKVVLKKANHILNSSNSSVVWDDYNKVITIKN